MKNTVYIIMVNDNRFYVKMYPTPGGWHIEDVCSVKYAKFFNTEESVTRQLKIIRNRAPQIRSKAFKVSLSIEEELA